MWSTHRMPWFCHIDCHSQKRQHRWVATPLTSSHWAVYPFLCSSLSWLTTAQNTNHIIMFVANTTALALISNNDDSADTDEPVAVKLVHRQQSLNVNTTKELMLDFRKTWPTHHKLRLLEDQVRLCPYNWRRLTQTTPSPQQKKLLQKLHFLRRLKLTSGYATAFIPRPKGLSTPRCLPESSLLPHPSNNRLIETLTNAQILYPNDRLAVLYWLFLM